ncbi:MAG: alpha/beta fold hydrolase [Bacillaceae bacterium]|nr:alpha/beta fold hydrolase [Bacillaceae bacterium]
MTIKRGSPESFFLEGDQSGLLLVHGFTGTTAELRPMGEYFHRLGMTVHAPLLAGHGTTPEEMAQTTWKDWWCSTVNGYKRLMEYGCTHVYAAGLSMGGLLALNLAYNYEIRGVVSMCAPVFLKDPRIHLTPILQKFMTYSDRDEKKQPHIEKEIFPYERTPIACIASLYQFIRIVKKRIPQITTPVLVAQGRKDETVRPRSARYIYNKIGSPIKEIKWYENSSHIITLDDEKGELFEDVRVFMEKLEQKDA